VAARWAASGKASTDNKVTQKDTLESVSFYLSDPTLFRVLMDFFYDSSFFADIEISCQISLGFFL
jgi:hypothetical protein